MSFTATLFLNILIGLAALIAYVMANVTRSPESLPIRRRTAIFIGASLSTGIRMLYNGYLVLNDASLTGSQRAGLFDDAMASLILFMGILLALFISQWRYERNARIALLSQRNQEYRA